MGNAFVEVCKAAAAAQAAAQAAQAAADQAATESQRPVGPPLCHNLILNDEKRLRAVEWYRDNIRNRSLPASTLIMRCSIADIDYVREIMTYFDDGVRYFLRGPIIEVINSIIMHKNNGWAACRMRNFFLDSYDWMKRLKKMTHGSVFPDRKADQLQRLLFHDVVSRYHMFQSAKRSIIVSEFITCSMKLNLTADDPYMKETNTRRPQVLKDLMDMLAFTGFAMLMAVKYENRFPWFLKKLKTQAERCELLMKLHDQENVTIPRSSAPDIPFKQEIEAPFIPVVYIDPQGGSIFPSYLQGLHSLTSEFQRIETILTNSLLIGAYATAYCSLFDICESMFGLWDGRLRVAMLEFYGEDIVDNITYVAGFSPVEVCYPYDKASIEEKSARKNSSNMFVQMVKKTFAAYHDDLTALLNPFGPGPVHFNHPLTAIDIERDDNLRECFEVLKILSFSIVMMVSDPKTINYKVIPELQQMIMEWIQSTVLKYDYSINVDLELNCQRGIMTVSDAIVDTYLNS